MATDIATLARELTDEQWNDVFQYEPSWAGYSDEYKLIAYVRELSAQLSESPGLRMTLSEGPRVECPHTRRKINALADRGLATVGEPLNAMLTPLGRAVLQVLRGNDA